MVLRTRYQDGPQRPGAPQIVVPLFGKHTE